MTSRFTKTVVLGALATMGALAWSGCGPGSDERYYCDNGGCYSCDAYGCTNVKGPAHPSCTSSSQCSTGLCTTKGCTTQCSTDAACPKGETCQSGLCFEPGGGGGTIIGGEDAGTTTGPGIDSGTTNPGTPCGSGPACASPNVCVSGACTAPQNACKFTSECETGKVCADGACLKPCTGGACDDGFTCQKDVCQPNAASPGDGGTTQPTTCDNDPICGTGKYCNLGTCTVDTRPKPNCTIDSDCGTGGAPKKCLAGYCKYTCSGVGTDGDQYCRTIDTRIGTCASDGVCRSSKEAAPQCTGPGTCPLAGQSCIDNQCK
jgi:hypothetical protein